MKNTIYTLVFCFIASVSQGQACHESGPEVHAMPAIGVMGGHTHSKGHFMATYRYMNMGMNGIIEGRQTIATDEVLENYMMAPLDMAMQMHMLGVMYAPTDRITLSAMSQLLVTTMNMQTIQVHMEMEGASHNHEPESYTMQNKGLGDTRLVGLYRWTSSETHCLHSISGIKLPTGGITAGDDMHQVYPFQMQTGSGSFEALLGLNYSWVLQSNLFGVQLLSSLPLHENQRGFMAPVGHKASVWAAHKWTSWFSTSLRCEAKYQTGLRGSDLAINPMMSPASNVNFVANQYADLLVGANFKPLDSWRLAIEGGVPVYQYSDGLSMQRTWQLVAGVQYLMHK